MNAQGGAPRAPTFESQLNSQEASASLQSTSLDIDFQHQQLHEKNVENKFINNFSENYEKALNNNTIDSPNLLKSSFATNSRVAFNLNCDTSYNSLESNNLLKTAGNQSFHQRNNLMFENMVTASSAHQNMDGMGFSSQVPGLPDNYPHHHSEMIGSNSISMNSNMNNFFPMNNMEYNGMGPMMTINETQRNNLSGMNTNHSMLSNRGEGFMQQVNSLDHSNSFHLGKHQNISPMNHIQNLAMSIGGIAGNTSVAGGSSMMVQARSPISNGNNHQHISNMHPMTKMMGMNNNFSQHRRIAPYPSPQKKNCPPVMPAAMHNYGNPHVPLHLQQHQNQIQYSDHPSLNGLPSPMSSTNYNYNRNLSSLGGGMGCVQRQPTPPYTNPMQHQFYTNSNHNTPNTSGISNSYTNFQNYQQDMRMNINNFQHSPVPGNPTPPLTPACSIPYVSPNPDAKPQIDNRDEEMRLTFPVRDGIILAPFRLLHNLSVSNHVFNLKATVFSTLMSRSDLELQLKCFHQEDRQMNTNWPQTVTVSANATPLVIERLEKTGHAFKPLYLKQVCQPGRNTLQLTASSCCCSHLFVLQLVHRPSVRQVLHSLHRRNLLPVPHSVAKIKQFFALGLAGQIPPSRDSVSPVNRDFMQISLICPITKNRIKFPARDHECKHIQCFDLESYLLLNCERGSWRCPICNNPALTEGLEIDQYIWAILNTLNQSLSVDEVTIDQFGNWQKVTKGNSEMEQLLNQNSCVLNPEEESNLYKNDSNSIKQENIERNDFKNNSIVMSPGSTAIPIWENSQAMSPYMCHDMNSIVNGNMIGQSQQNKFDSFGNNTNENVSGIDSLSQLNDTIGSLNSINGVKNSKEQMPFTTLAAGSVPSHLLAQNAPLSVNSSQCENLNRSNIENNDNTSIQSNSQDNSNRHNLSQPPNNVSSQNNNKDNQLPSFIQESQQHQFEPSSPKNNKNETDTLTSDVDSTSNANNQNNTKGNNSEQQQNQIIDSFLSSQSESLINLNETDLNENLNFDTSGADSDPTNELNLLSNSLVDPMEILKYLDPQPNLNTPPSSGSSSNPNQDENILASLFD